mgnify:CR=1 FL=1
MQLLTAHLARFLCLLGICLSAQAKVSLPNIFGDHMVLQREQANPVWGKASPGEKVSVSIGGQSHTTITTADGSWQVTLEPLEVGGPYELEIRGNNTLTFSDILVGEVWVCSGQSNMEWPMSDIFNAQEEIAQLADYANIRIYRLELMTSDQPENDLLEEDFKWAKSNETEYINPFSAVCLLTARYMADTLGKDKVICSL